MNIAAYRSRPARLTPRNICASRYAPPPGVASDADSIALTLCQRRFDGLRIDRHVRHYS